MDFSKPFYLCGFMKAERRIFMRNCHRIVRDAGSGRKGVVRGSYREAHSHSIGAVLRARGAVCEVWGGRMPVAYERPEGVSWVEKNI